MCKTKLKEKERKKKTLIGESDKFSLEKIFFGRQKINVGHKFRQNFYCLL